jgi:hypothetical protein
MQATLLTEVSFLGIQIYDHLNWKSHVGLTLPKLHATDFAFRGLFYGLHIVAVSIVYFS